MHGKIMGHYCFALMFWCMTTPLLACSSTEITLCQKKFRDAEVSRTDGSLHIPLTNDRSLIVSPSSLQDSYAISNPFLGLYVVQKDHGFAYPYRFDILKPERWFALDGIHAHSGRMLRPQKGLNDLGYFEHAVSERAIVVDACCAFEGVITPEGMIDKHYLMHTLHSQGRVVYGDAGIRIAEGHRYVIVESVDPFSGYQPFQQGDHITEFDGITIVDKATLMRHILLAKPGTKHRIGIRRFDKDQEVTVTLGERQGGGLVSDTYLEHLGIFFDQHLKVIQVSEEARALGIALGDTLLQVNSDVVHRDEDVRQKLGTREEKVSLLFQRNGFQFFVQLPFHKL